MSDKDSHEKTWSTKCSSAKGQPVQKPRGRNKFLFKELREAGVWSCRGRGQAGQRARACSGFQERLVRHDLVCVELRSASIGLEVPSLTCHVGGPKKFLGLSRALSRNQQTS